MDDDVEPLTIQLLEWMASHPRTYGQVMEAWRSTCPRHSVWEDALIAGLIEVRDEGDAMNAAAVTLTELGRRVLDGRKPFQ